MKVNVAPADPPAKRTAHTRDALKATTQLHRDNLTDLLKVKRTALSEARCRVSKLEYEIGRLEREQDSLEDVAP